MSSHFKKILVFFLGVWIVYGFTISQSDLKAYGLQHAGVEAIVQYKTFQLGLSQQENLKPRGDVFEHDGKILAAKQPGQFVLGALPYFLISRFGITYEKNYYLAAWLVTWFSSTLVCALAIACFFYLLRFLWQFSFPISLFSSLAFGLATTIFPYSGIEHHDTIGISYLFIAFTLIEHNYFVHKWQSKVLAVLSGIFLGLTLFTTMLPALVVAVLLLYIGFSRNWQCIIASGIGFLAGLFPLAIYNTYYFGNPFVSAYKAGQWMSYVSVSVNNIEKVLYNLNYYFGFGWLSVFKFMPVVILGILGILCIGRALKREKILFLAIIIIHCFYIINIKAFGDCQYGPRYLIPVIPFMIIGLPFLLQWAKLVNARIWVSIAILGATLYSFGVNCLGAMHGTMYCGFEKLAFVHHFQDYWQNDKEALFAWSVYMFYGIVVFIVLWNTYRKEKASPNESEVVDLNTFGGQNLMKKYFIGIIVLIAAMNIVRFTDLEQSPPGFFIDEAATAVCVQCLVEEGIDSVGRPYPLFGQLGFGTPRPPTLMYFSFLWTKLFGFSIVSFRTMSAFFTLLTIAGLFGLTRLFFDRHCALLVVLAASISPWAFQFSRIYWEAPYAPCLIIWGTYFFLRQNKGLDLFLSGLLFSLAMYSYPPAKAQVPLMVFPLFFLKWKQHGLKTGSTLLFFLSLIGVSIPLVTATFGGEFQERFTEVTIFSQSALQSMGKTGTLWDMVTVFFKNVLLYLNPGYLFLSGDPNLRHSSQFTGQLGWLDAFALILGIGYWVQGLCEEDTEQTKQSGHVDNIFLIFVLANIVIGIIPSALTDSGGYPHALRSIGTWPFVSLLTGYILWRTMAQWRFVRPATLVLSAVFAVAFLNHYFFKYPKMAREYFDASLKESAQIAQSMATPANPIWEQIIWKHYPHRQGMHARYYLMNYKGETCSSSREPFLISRKLISSSMSADEYNRVGLQLIAQQDWPEAIKHLSAALQKDPNHIEAHKNIAAVWNFLGERQKATEASQRAQELEQSLEKVPNE